MNTIEISDEALETLTSFQGGECDHSATIIHMRDLIEESDEK
jgi:hypothetical protein